MEFNWRKRPTSNQKQQSDLEAEISHLFPEHYMPFDVFSAVTNLDALVKIIAGQSNFHAQQNDREFRTN